MEWAYMKIYTNLSSSKPAMYINKQVEGTVDKLP